MAANIFLTLPHHTLNQARGHAVYLRRSWQADWVQVQWLFARQISWGVAPTVGTATLVWRYGEGMRQGELLPAQVAKLDSRLSYYVGIDVRTGVLDETGLNEELLTWVGTVEIETRHMLGVLGRPGGEIPSGEQILACVGLEQLLRLEPVRKSVWLKGTGEGVFTADRLMVFNQPDATGKAKGNRALNEYGGSHLFSSQEQDNNLTTFWNSRSIAKYLVAQHQPKADTGTALPFVVETAGLALVPDWDQPVIAPAVASTVGDLLDATLPIGRALTWECRYNSDDNTIEVVPKSLLGAAVATPLGNLAANPRRLAVIADQNPSWSCVPHGTGLEKIDQVRIASRRRTSTLTLSKLDGTLDIGWTPSQKTEYQTGASAEPAYAGWDTATKQRANAECRAAEKIRNVFRRFAIVANWNQKVKDGLGTDPEQLVFRKFDPSNSEPYPVNPRELWIQPALAMQDGYNYENLGPISFPTPPVETATAPHNHLRPLVIFKNPEPIDEYGTHRYVQVEHISVAAELEFLGGDVGRWHGSVHVPVQDRAILIHVSGAPQHVLAASDFTRLPVDPAAGGWDWREALFTVTLEDDRHCEGVWPEESQIAGTTGAPRRLLQLDAGDQYRLDWMVPGTVIGVEATTGELVRCTNGGWIRDDRNLLVSRARQAFEYYRQPRQAVVFSGLDLAVGLSIRPGDYIESWGQEDPLTVGSLVSQVTIDLPSGQPGSVSAPTITFHTAFAELDPTLFLGGGP